MNKRNAGIIFTVVLIGLFIFFMAIQDGSFFMPGEPYRIVFLGDSIVGNVRDDTSITAKLEKQLGVRILNGGFGGTCATRTDRNTEASLVSDNLCMPSVVEALVYRDFGVLNASVGYGMRYTDVNRQTLPYFRETVQQLQRVKLQDTEVLVLSYGTNDYTRAARLDNPEDPYDVNSFGGSLRFSIELLQKRYPDLQIVLATPIYCILFLEEGTLDCTEKDFGSGYLKDFIDLEKQIGEEYGLTVIDNYADSGINARNWEEYLYDGMHPNEAGRELIARNMEKQLRSIFTEGGKTK